MIESKSSRAEPQRGRAYARSILPILLIACLAVGADQTARGGMLQESAPPRAAVQFARENDAAMDRMMAAMTIKPTGHVDADFVAMMIPHHQGAIDMAVAELRHGSNPQLKRIAQEIIIEQQQEIAAMRLAIGQPLPPSMPAPTRSSPPDGGAGMAPTHHHSALKRDPSK